MILAFDPSINNLGWAVISDPVVTPKRIFSSCWHPSSSKNCPDRYDQLACMVRDLVNQYSELSETSHFDTLRIIVENPSGGQRHSAKQLMVYAKAIGVVEASCMLSGYPVRRVTVNEWKGRAKKGKTELEVKAFFGYTPRTDHESDALGLALWAARNPFSKVVAKKAKKPSKIKNKAAC